jgi:putative transposase
MPNNPLAHQRKSIRLKGYDYTCPGAYFVTITAYRRACVFGEIEGGVMRLNEWGNIVAQCWSAIPDHYCDVVMDEFTIMPNHIHGIIVICENDVKRAYPVGATHGEIVGAGCGDIVGAGLPRPYGNEPTCVETEMHTPTLGQIVAVYKYQTTKRINQIRGTPGAPVWQRNYWDHIIRDDDDLFRIREYIHNNPVQWETDVENGGDPA